MQSICYVIVYIRLIHVIARGVFNRLDVISLAKTSMFIMIFLIRFAVVAMRRVCFSGNVTATALLLVPTVYAQLQQAATDDACNFQVGRSISHVT